MVHTLRQGFDSPHLHQIFIILTMQKEKLDVLDKIHSDVFFIKNLIDDKKWDLVYYHADNVLAWIDFDMQQSIFADSEDFQKILSQINGHLLMAQSLKDVKHLNSFLESFPIFTSYYGKLRELYIGIEK
jgi:hypothetical protein